MWWWGQIYKILFFLNPFITSQTRKKGVKYPKIVKTVSNGKKCCQILYILYTWTRNLILRSDFKNYSFLGSSVTSQTPKKGWEIPQITWQQHKMAKDTVKYFKYCMDKFIWARILMIRSRFLNSIFLSSVVASQKKETSCHP